MSSESKPTALETDRLYHTASKAVDEYLEIHKGETFDLDTICRHMEIHEATKRKLIAIKLAYEVKQGKLEKNNRLYRYIDNNIKYIEWVNASESETLAIKWPADHETDGLFPFENHAVVSPGDVIVLAGVSNMGKTAFCLNFLFDNMDYMHCTYFALEFSPSKFKRRISHMTWANPLNEDGTPKFDLVERHKDWKDIIRPNDINIIDWINLGDNFYQMGTIIEGIQSPLKGGIAVISLQKDANKNMGIGGQFGEHMAAIYMTLDYNRLTVVKCKEWDGYNPNGKVYGFELHNAGTCFSNIRELIKCQRCYGTGHTKGGECDDCNGTGYRDK